MTGRCLLCPAPAGVPCAGECRRGICEQVASADDHTHRHGVGRALNGCPPPAGPPVVVDLTGARPEPPLPGLAAQAGSLLSAAVAWVVSDAPALTPAQVAARLAVCEGTADTPRCDNYRPSDGRCGGSGGCGCWVEPKAAMASQTCPRNLWPKP